LPRPNWHGVLACAALAGLTACGDGPTHDNRGYTKAPLEHIGVFIRPEARSDVHEFAVPNLPERTRLPSPAPADSGGG